MRKPAGASSARATGRWRSTWKRQEKAIQTLSAWHLIPFFVLVYGPALLIARFLGSWVALRHVRLLRQRHDVVHCSGLGMVTELGYGPVRSAVGVPQLEPVTVPTPPP